MKKSLDFDHRKVQIFLLSNGWNKIDDLVPGVVEQYSKDNKIVDLLVESRLPSYNSYLKDTVSAISILEKEQLTSIVKKIKEL